MGLIYVDFGDISALRSIPQLIALIAKFTLPPFVDFFRLGGGGGRGSVVMLLAGDLTGD